MSKLQSILLLIAAGIIAWLIANIGIDTSNMEMAAIANIFFPPLIALAALIIFLLFDWRFPSKRSHSTIVLIILVIIPAIMIRFMNTVPV